MVRLLQCWGWWRCELRVRNFRTMLGRRAWDWWKLWTQSVPVIATINSVNEAPEALNDYSLRNNSGSLAIFAAIRRASSRVNQLTRGPIALQPSLDEQTLAAKLFDEGVSRGRIGKAPAIMGFAAPQNSASMSQLNVSRFVELHDLAAQGNAQSSIHGRDFNEIRVCSLVC